MNFLIVFRTKFVQDFIRMILTFGSTGIITIIGSIIISHVNNSLVSADIFKLIALTNLVTFTLILPIEAITSKYLAQSRTILIYGVCIIPLFVSILSCLLWTFTSHSDRIGFGLVFTYSFSVAMSQMFASFLAGSGSFFLLSRVAVTGLVAFVFFLPLLYLIDTHAHYLVLTGFITSNVVSSIYGLLKLSKTQLVREKYGHERCPRFAYKDLIGIYIALMMSFGIATFILTGAIIFAERLRIAANLIIEFSLITSFLRIPYAVLAIVGSPFRSQIRQLKEQFDSAKIVRLVFRAEFLVVCLLIPFTFSASFFTVFLVGLNGSTNGLLSWKFIQILSISEMAFFAASLLQICNSLFLKGFFLAIPWFLALISFFVVLYLISDPVQILVFTIFVPSIVLLCSTGSIAAVFLRRLR